MKKLLSAIFLVLFAAASSAADGIKITDNGKSNAVIVIPAKACEVTAFAAEELQLWIKEISGAKLPISPPKSNAAVQIVLALNPANMKKELAAIGKTDGFAIRTNGNVITIAATRGTGLLRGVHALLFSNTDIIWARPDEKFGTIFSKKPTLVFTKTDFLSVPKYAMRGFQFPNFYHKPSELWQIRNKSSYSAYSVVNGKRQTRYFDDFYTYAGYHNIVGVYMPGHKYYAKHPEFYNLINGRRKNPAEGGHLNTGLCLSNEECFKEWQKNFFERVERNPDYDTFGVVLEDTFDACECPGCTAPIKLPGGKVLTLKDQNYRSTQFFLWLNRIAEELHKRYPDKKIKTNAYYQTEFAPSCKVNPIIQVSFAPIFRDSKYTISHPRNRATLNKFLPWSKCGVALTLRDYFGLVKEFPRPIDAIAVADWHELHTKYNVDRTMSEMVHDSATPRFADGKLVWDQNMPYFWVLCNAPWDPSKGVEYYRNEFFKRVYGDAADDVKEYYSLFEQAWKKSPGQSNWHESPYGAWAKAIVYLPGLEGKLRAALQRAAKKKLHPNSRIMLERLTASFEKMIKFETVSFQAAYTDKTPEFDPEFKSGDWKNTEVNDVFTPYMVGKAKVKTEVRMLHDDENLYVGVRCFDTIPGRQAHFVKTPRDQWPIGNMVEFLIGDAKNKRIQLAMNTGGSIFDNKDMKGEWEGFFDVPIKFNDKGWSVLLTVPFSLLEYETKPDFVNLHILRYYTAPDKKTRQALFWQRYDLSIDGVLAFPKIKLLKKGVKIQRPLTAGEKAMQGKTPEELIYNQPQSWHARKNVSFADGVFTVTGKTEMRGKNIIPVDPAKTYTITLSAGQPIGSKSSLLYVCVQPLDKNKRWISAESVNAVNGTETELLAPVKKGDKQLIIKDGAKWKLTNRGGIHYNAKKDLSDLPNRNSLKAFAQKITAADGKWIVELNKPAAVDLPAGTIVRQSKSGGYYNLFHTQVGEEKLYKVAISGQSLLPETGKWWPGVRFFQLQLLVNWGAGQGNNQTEIKNIIFEAK